MSRDKRTRGLGLYSAKSDNADSIYSVAVLIAAVSSSVCKNSIGVNLTFAELLFARSRKSSLGFRSSDFPELDFLWSRPSVEVSVEDLLSF